MKIDVQGTIWFQTEAEVSSYNDPHLWGDLKLISVTPIRSQILIGALLNQPHFKIRKLRLREEKWVKQLQCVSSRTQARSSQPPWSSLSDPSVPRSAPARGSSEGQGSLGVKNHTRVCIRVWTATDFHPLPEPCTGMGGAHTMVNFPTH